MTRAHARFPLALAVVLALATGIWLIRGGGRSASPVEGLPVAAPASAAGDETPADLAPTAIARRCDQIRRTAVAPGGSLDRALRDVLPQAPDRARAIEGLAAELDLRRLPAGTGVTVQRDPVSNTACAVSVRADPERFVRLRLDTAEAVRPEVVELPTVVSVEAVEGAITHSVHDALAGAGHGPLLVMQFSDIFQWDIDLLTEPRPGDRVRVVYETRRLAAVPRDLPSFGALPDRAGRIVGEGRILAASYDGQRASSRAYWIDGPEAAAGYYDDGGRSLRKTFLKSPLSYRRISSGFSRARRHPITRKVVPHHGVDFAAPAGTPVVASADGRVVSAGWEGALGRAVRIRHGSAYETVYGHLRAFARGIGKGVRITQGQPVGYVGSTGRATGPHLHYTLIQNGRPIDPLRFRSPEAKPLPATLAPGLEQARWRWSFWLDTGSGLVALLERSSGS